MLQQSLSYHNVTERAQKKQIMPQSKENEEQMRN